jgi:hypothetical protein
MYFPQPSRENVDPLWSSPYTITLSALNTWIGEEVRLTGLEAALVHRGDNGERAGVGQVETDLHDPRAPGTARLSERPAGEF